MGDEARRMSLVFKESSFCVCASLQGQQIRELFSRPCVPGKEDCLRASKEFFMSCSNGWD